MSAYDHKKIEKKWQDFWAQNKIYTTPDSVPGKDNFFLLVEFPYPSGNLHVGHWYAFAVPDILARTLRMKGKNVLYPIGFDAFGLPAENAAIKNKVNPREWTEKNIAYMTKQIESMGTMFDWSRKVSTIDPEYYKWTQWLFLQFYKKGLVYQRETAVNWCPSCKTVLANEQVVDGKCERCGTEVVQKQMLQWNIKITEYADRLVDDLAELDWPEPIKDAQRAWIGRSEGAEIDFPLDIGKKYKFVILHGFESAPDRPRWIWAKQKLQEMGYEVVLPRLPNPDNPSEEEWVRTALECTDYDENTVLVGHSLGAVAALKVAERLTKPIARLVTVGGFCSPKFKDKPRPFNTTWNWQFIGEKIRANTKSITVLHDPRDTSVDDARAKELADLLQVPVTLGTSNKPHFTGDTEPDVIMWLRPTVRVFTTRADTLFGATYLVLAPEHPWVNAALEQKIVQNTAEVQKYITAASKKTELERQTETKEKTGVKLEGVEAVNPATGEKIPVYIADYVLASYGTGAIMAVPAHDERDGEFAQKFGIEIKQVVEPISVVTDGVDAIRPGQEFVKREVVDCIVRDPKTDKYLVVKWKNVPWVTFVTGGIETDTPIEGGAREILEESGYKNVKFIRELGAPVHAKFYHVNKKVNRWARCQGLYFELVDDAHDPLAPEEAALHDVAWLTAGEVEKQLNIPDMRMLWRRYRDGEKPFTGEGILMNSGEFDWMSTEEARKAITETYGRAKKTYRLRDWIVSRQRYWGVPIPIVHCEKCGANPVPDDQLPVLLPDVEDYLPDGKGKSPLAKVASFVEAQCPVCGGRAERETDTFDTFVDSSWYFLRYADPSNSNEFASKEKLAAWMPVDLYSGGAEHTTMHVLYSRFWQKALYDLGLVGDKEPYTRRMNRSLIMGPDGQKMSKSRGNVIDPDEVVSKLGADTVRMYLAFIGPYNEVASYPWNPDGVVGVRRFIERVWRLSEKLRDGKGSEASLHRAIKKVSDDIPKLKFNTAISALMIFLNDAEKNGITKDQYATFVRILAPFAPHMAEELWHMLGNDTSVHIESWPSWEEKLLQEENVTYAIQIDGKTRGEVTLPTDADDKTIEQAAAQAVADRLVSANVARVVIVSKRLVNFVLSAKNQ